MCASSWSWRDAGAEQRRDPVDQLGGRRLLAELALLAQPVELDQHLVEQRRVEVRVVHGDDPPHQRRVGELDVVEDAAAQERVGQLLLVVRGDDDDRAARVATISSPVSMTVKRISSSSRRRSFGNSRSALSTSSMRSTWRVRRPRTPGRAGRA